MWLCPKAFGCTKHLTQKKITPWKCTLLAIKKIVCSFRWHGLVIKTYQAQSSPEAKNLHKIQLKSTNLLFRVDLTLLKTIFKRKVFRHDSSDYCLIENLAQVQRNTAAAISLWMSLDSLSLMSSSSREQFKSLRQIVINKIKCFAVHSGNYLKLGRIWHAIIALGKVHNTLFYSVLWICGQGMKHQIKTLLHL